MPAVGESCQVCGKPWLPGLHGGVYHDCLVQHIDTEFVKLRQALRNCLLLAMRESRRQNTRGWEHIIRFCKEVGVEPSPLRGEDEVSAQ